MANGHSQEAIATLDSAIQKFEKADLPDYALMAKGYAGIAKTKSELTEVEGKEQLNESIKALEKIGSDDAKFFARPLQTAAKVFSE